MTLIIVFLLLFAGRTHVITSTINCRFASGRQFVSIADDFRFSIQKASVRGREINASLTETKRKHHVGWSD